MYEFKMWPWHCMTKLKVRTQHRRMKNTTGLKSTFMAFMSFDSQAKPTK